MPSPDFLPIYSNAEILRKNIPLIQKFQKQHYMNGITQSLLEDANKTVGAVLEFEVITQPEIPEFKAKKAVQMGQGRFDGIQEESEGYIAKFTLMPEGVACPIPLELVELPQIPKPL